MSTMGGACSSRQKDASESSRGRLHSDSSRFATGQGAMSSRSLRHSVVAPLPDDSIAKLYPISDNYVIGQNNLRSPKTLAELCIDTLCRSLPNLDGELPRGVPQEVVDALVDSLLRHSALNATTLRVLKNCELASLRLSGCRGVTDEWLAPLSARKPKGPAPVPKIGIERFAGDQTYWPEYPTESNPLHFSPLPNRTPRHDNEDQKPSAQSNMAHHGEDESCSTYSYLSACSQPRTPGGDAKMSTSTPVAYLTPRETAGESTDHQPMEEHGLPLLPELGPSHAVTNSITLLDLRGSQDLTDKGLLQLRDLVNLEVARFDGCHSLVGKGFLALEHSHRLHTLSVANCRRLTDEALVNISHLTSIEAVSLDGCRCITDRSLVAISGLHHLQKLDLSQCDLISDTGLENLEDLELLNELSLGWCRSVTDRGIDILTSQPGRDDNLLKLRLARCQITDEGIEYLGRLRSLEELDLNGCAGIGSAKLGRTLIRLPSLTNLDVSYCPGILRSSWQGMIQNVQSLELSYAGVRDSHLARLTNLPALEELNLDSCPIGDWAIAHLSDNNVTPNLKSLGLADTDLTDLGMAKLAKFTELTRLSLFYCNITNNGLRHLSKLKKLEDLNLDSREVSDEGLLNLRYLPLKSLDLFSGRITDTGCAHLSKIKTLECLQLCGGGVGDLGCQLLATLENLQTLNLSQNERITNRGAAAFAALTQLKSLNLSHTRVTAAVLPIWGDSLVQLESLALYECRGMTNNDSSSLVEGRLAAGLPNLKCLRLSKCAPDEGRVANDGSLSISSDPESMMEEESEDDMEDVGDEDDEEEDDELSSFVSTQS